MLDTCTFIHCFSIHSRFWMIWMQVYYQRTINQLMPILTASWGALEPSKAQLPRRNLWMPLCLMERSAAWQNPWSKQPWCHMRCVDKELVVTAGQGLTASGLGPWPTSKLLGTPTESEQTRSFELHRWSSYCAFQERTHGLLCFSPTQCQFTSYLFILYFKICAGIHLQPLQARHQAQIILFAPH